MGDGYVDMREIDLYRKVDIYTDPVYIIDVELLESMYKPQGNEYGDEICGYYHKKHSFNSANVFTYTIINLQGTEWGTWDGCVEVLLPHSTADTSDYITKRLVCSGGYMKVSIKQALGVRYCHFDRFWA